MTIRVGVNGYGAIGKRVADAVRLQDDMELVGVADLASDWRPRVTHAREIPLFHAGADGGAPSGVVGTLTELMNEVDVIVDCTPKGIGARNATAYREAGVKFVLQGAEKHDVTGHSFVAESNYGSALGRDCTRVVSCNTTSIVRTLAALKAAGVSGLARGTLLRRATDPWESHLGGIMNTIVPESTVPSHQAPDARTVDPELRVSTMALKVPETLAHVHCWSVDVEPGTSRDELMSAFAASSRIASARFSDGLGAVNAVKELTADLGRSRGDLYEVVVWEELVTVDETGAYYAYMVDNQAIVIPENIDAIRALSGSERSGAESIARTDAALGVRSGRWPDAWNGPTG